MDTINKKREKQIIDPTLVRLLTKANSLGASDIHITAGKTPIYRIHGEMQTLKEPLLSNNDTGKMVRSLVKESEWLRFVETRELDLSFSIPNVSRFRVNAFYQQDTVSIALRIISNNIPSLRSLQLPPIIRTITNEHSGLVLVTGPTGSGKSSTLAAMIDSINRTKKRHIITLEDPIEYVHKNNMSLIDQREVGTDTLSFENGLRASLRQDPDIILVGELRDLDTIKTAVTAAETGHLVLATLHTNGAVPTIERIIDMFPPDQQIQIRVQLAATLRAVIAQQLLPLKDGSGRRAVTEILLNTPAVSNLIAGGKTGQIMNVLQTNKTGGMHTLAMAIKLIAEENIIADDVIASYIGVS